jgi:hypothetical protein
MMVMVMVSLRLQFVSPYLVYITEYSDVTARVFATSRNTHIVRLIMFVMPPIFPTRWVFVKKYK